MRKLPVGIQTFSTIREENYLYVDKTGMAVDLVEQGAYYFLARPRRFGKSLFVSTLQALFEGQKKLFRGLAAYERWDWQVKYPVIKLSFAGVSQTVPDIQQTLFEMLKKNQLRLHVSCGETADIGAILSELIAKSHNKFGQRVVLLLDEYDKSILDNIENRELVQEVREALDKIYSAINDNDEHLKFVFVTGLTRIADLSLFSGLNNLEDLTFNGDFASICGYTQYDLDTIFFSLLQNVDKEKLNRWYGGYNFLGENVYNPFDILLFLKNSCKFEDYWAKSNLPALAAKLAVKQRYFVPLLEAITVNSSVLERFTVEDPTLASVLYSGGYLTVKKVGKAGVTSLYKLSYPNLETRASFNNYLIDSLAGESGEKAICQQNIFSALKDCNMPLLQNTLNVLFASLPAVDKESELGYPGTILYMYLASLGIEMLVKRGNSERKLTATLSIKTNIYFLEFSVDEPDTPLQKPQKDDSLQHFLASGKNVYVLSIVLSSKEQALTHFKSRQLH